MSSEDYSSSEEDEDVTGEQVAQYLGAIMKLNAKLFGNERKHEQLLSMQSKTEPPQSNSKFGVGRPQQNFKFGVEPPHSNSKFVVGSPQH